MSRHDDIILFLKGYHENKKKMKFSLIADLSIADLSISFFFFFFFFFFLLLLQFCIFGMSSVNFWIFGVLM